MLLTEFLWPSDTRSPTRSCPLKGRFGIGASDFGLPAVAKLPKQLPSWWDREFDESRRPIRRDVRQAAIKVWSRVCAQVYKILGDFSEAPELLERSVEKISIYLDKIHEPPTEPSGLLFVAVYRLARRVARGRHRVQAVGNLSDLPDLPAVADLEDRLQRQIFVDELLAKLRPENQGVLRLRLEGFSWEEIGTMFQIAPAALQKRFWRDVRRVHFHILEKDRKSE
jgi:DNA-directed RNA polymerase specialized sigma24 family protein